jgi:hypothetical protein
MPARRSLAESEAHADKVGAQIAAAARASMDSTVVRPFYVGEDRLDATELFYEAAIEVCEGNASPQEALGEAQLQSRLK